MAGKEFRRDQVVGDRVGKNEKTRITCKLQKPGSGPPGREPGVSEDERKAMMAFYFKRQEELKRLAEVRVYMGGVIRSNHHCLLVLQGMHVLHILRLMREGPFLPYFVPQE